MKKSSPSRYASIELCPAFVDDPNRPTHPITEEGTKIHDALDRCDFSELNEFQTQLAEMCRDLVASIIPEGAVVKTELKLPSIFDDSGRADLVALKGTTAWLIDYKMGNNLQTPAKNNAAAQAYVMGLFQTFPYLAQVHVTYAYPRLDAVDQWTYRRKDLDAIVARLTAIKERAETATPETCHYVPHICQYCIHLGKCPTAIPQALPLLRKYNETHDNVALPEIGDLATIEDPEIMAKLRNAADVLIELGGSIKHHAVLFRTEKGLEIPGWTMDSKKGRSSILDVLTAWEICRQHGFSQEQFIGCCTVTPKKLLDVAKENAAKGQKSKAADALRNALEDSGTLKDGAETRTLVRVKDQQTENQQKTP